MYNFIYNIEGVVYEIQNMLRCMYMIWGEPEPFHEIFGRKIKRQVSQPADGFSTRIFFRSTAVRGELMNKPGMTDVPSACPFFRLCAYCVQRRKQGKSGQR